MYVCVCTDCRETDSACDRRSVSATARCQATTGVIDSELVCLRCTDRGRVNKEANSTTVSGMDSGAIRLRWIRWHVLLCDCYKQEAL